MRSGTVSRERESESVLSHVYGIVPDGGLIFLRPNLGYSYVHEKLNSQLQEI